MEVVHQRCAGLDVSKRDVKVCVRAPGKRRGSHVKPVSTFGSVTAEMTRPPRLASHYGTGIAGHYDGPAGFWGARRLPVTLVGG